MIRKKIVLLPYDMDTAAGINNEGSLVFSYNLEDIDKTDGGAEVFNGQQSVLWRNLREMFGPELKAMYQKLRSTGALSYDRIEKAFEEHQAKWPEAIFNEDSWFKYLVPLEEKGSAAYLAMLQGSKAEQRKWWLYNRFKYIDSKYNAGDSLTDVITLRGYAKSNITIRPYAFRDAAYNALIDLCTDICRRNGKKKLLWFADKAKTISYQPATDEMVLTVHRWFANKACPGDWMYSRMGDLADKVTARLNGSTTTTPTPPTTTSTPSITPSAPSNTPYLVRITNRLVSIKKGPGTNYSSYGYIQPGVYTIVDEQNGWGLLKAYAKYRNGWIPLNCVKKV